MARGMTDGLTNGQAKNNMPHFFFQSLGVNIDEDSHKVYNPKA